MYFISYAFTKRTILNFNIQNLSCIKNDEHLTIKSIFEDHEKNRKSLEAWIMLTINIIVYHFVAKKVDSTEMV